VKKLVDDDEQIIDDGKRKVKGRKTCPPSLLAMFMNPHKCGPGGRGMKEETSAGRSDGKANPPIASN